MELYIARHGETIFNTESRLQGSGLDSPLTPTGQAQAHALGQALSGHNFDAVYSSPLNRARDTVKIATNDTIIPILDQRLVEIGLGKIEGMQWDDAIEQYPQAAGRLTDPVNYIPPPGAETLNDMLDRVNSFMTELIQKGYKKVFVLTHSYTMRVFEACAGDNTVEAIGKTNNYKNCDIARYKYEDGKWTQLGIISPTSSINNESLIPQWNKSQAKSPLKTDKSLAPLFVLFAFITALIYTISFTGVRVYPQLSFFIFCAITLILLYTLLKRLDWLSHKSAFLWAIPIMIFAGFNLVFGRSAFTYINVVVVWILFAFVIFGAIHGAKYSFGALFFWVNTAKVIMGNVAAGIHLLSDTSKTFKLTRSHPAMRFLMGIGIAIPLLGVLFALMMSADQVFSHIVRDFFEGDGDFNWHRFFGHITVTIIATAFAAGYVYQAKFMSQSYAKFKALSLDKIIALAFLSAINILFLFFCYIQLAYLFMGGFNTLPEGVIFADYAREGFFQLLFIVVINFAVIIFFLQIYSYHARTGVVRFMLVLLTLFTGVLIASSFYRMNLYMRVFGFTPLRMSVITFLVMAVFLCLATLLALFKSSFDVMRVYLIIGMIFLVVANVSGSGFVSGRLNANLYRRSNEYHFTMRDHFWDADNAASLMEIYRLTDNDNLQSAIRWRLERYQAVYENEPWQNRSIIKRINLRQIERFLQ
ncbi:MAG: DUF4173 domain-containing protein [Defluviitaleaceae bacterium]|nr:DUF4173 domain-containing protein [Defluviitaleaceae bacterium]